MAHGLAFSSLAALAPRMLVLRISRRSLSLAPRNAIKSPVFYYLGPGSRCMDDMSFAVDNLVPGTKLCHVRTGTFMRLVEKE